MNDRRLWQKVWLDVTTGHPPCLANEFKISSKRLLDISAVSI